MGRGMMGGGAMGPPPVMLCIMFALIDTDGDGTIELQEFQAAHERIFKAMDTNKDGKLTLEEMQAFVHGTRCSVSSDKYDEKTRTASLGAGRCRSVVDRHAARSTRPLVKK